MGGDGNPQEDMRITHRNPWQGVDLRKITWAPTDSHWFPSDLAMGAHLLASGLPTGSRGLSLSLSVVSKGFPWVPMA